MKKLTHIRAIACDLDGTLLMPDKTLGGRTLKTLGACMERGIKVILATGRGVESVEPYRKTIGAPGPQVYYNGAEVFDMPAGKIIHAQLLAAAPVLFCLELARKNDLYLQVYFPANSLPAGTFGVPASNKEILLTEKPGPESDYYLKNSGLQALTGDLEGALSVPGLVGLIKCMFITKEECQEGLKNSIRERFGDSVTIVRSSPTYLEILAKGVSKGVGLTRALEYLSIDPKDTIVFGDEENDLPMFAAAGYSAAPANAAAVALEAAGFHIGSNAGEGVAAFLEEAVLI
jgi:Cof subfamily protein (haloacid dehalogenase superfamily)